jgi:hypothetical protein
LWDLHVIYIIEAVLGHIDRAAEARLLTHDDLRVYPYEVFYPAMQLERTVGGRRRIAEQSGSHAIHHFDDCWSTPSMKMFCNARYVLHRIVDPFGTRKPPKRSSSSAASEPSELTRDGSAP